jgi:glycosyltransferase involved in cell wall biosynthesis
VFALIETGAQKLIELGIPPERLRLSGVVPLLPHHVDPQGFRRRHGLDDKPVVLFIGRMVEYKGCLAILNAAKRVWREMPDVQFLFAGPAGTRQAQWVAELGDRRARYLGLISDQEKGDALAACDLFCMPSTAEILPAVYLDDADVQMPAPLRALGVVAGARPGGVRPDLGRPERGHR